MRWLLALSSIVASGCVLEGDRSFSAVYQGCGQTADCAHGVDACFTVAWEAGRGGMCSAYCEVDADCPGWAGCYALGGDLSGTRICYAKCSSEADCASGFLCAQATRDGRAVGDICLPQ